MRIALVTPRYLPMLGGVENHVAHLARWFADHGHDVTVATQAVRADELPSHELADGIAVRRFLATVPLLGHGLSGGLVRWLRAGAGGADVVHVHNAHAMTTAAALLAAPSPVVFTPHYLGRGETRALRTAHAVYDVPLRRAVRRVDRVVCTTAWEAGEFARDVGGGEHIDVVPNGVAPPRAGPVPPSVRPPEGSGPLIVVAGRVERYKQADRVVAALPNLPDHRLVVLGDGPFLSDLTALAVRSGVESRTRFVGRVPHEEVSAWFERADVVASLSRRECFGMTLAEGLLAGASVLASDIGAHRDVLELGGSDAFEVVPVDADPRTVARAVERLGRRGGRSPARFPTWSDVSGQIEAIYRSVLAT